MLALAGYPLDFDFVFFDPAHEACAAPLGDHIHAAYDDEAALERQRRMAEQLAELEERRRDARRAAQALAEAGGPTVTARSTARDAAAGPAPIGARGVAHELRDPKALRRAMVLREILDAPVALR